jgi:hypothetical protein
MPHHFEFDPAHRILLVVLEGEIRDEEFRRMNADIRKHASGLNLAAGVSDFSLVTKLDVASHTLREAALQPPPYLPEMPRFVVAPTDYIFGMARMYELIANRPMGKLQVARSREEVFAALGVHDPKFEKLDRV